jgi:hypothetical protein
MVVAMMFTSLRYIVSQLGVGPCPDAPSRMLLAVIVNDPETRKDVPP